MKMYILVRDNIPLGFAMVAVAHASLVGYLRFQDEPEVGVHLISVQKVTVRASPQSEDWRGVCSRGERKCLSRFEFLLVS